MAFNVSRIFRISLCFLLLCCALISRLIYLQIIESTNLALYALISRVQEFPVAVSRGEIIDCRGNPLTNNSQQYSVLIFPGQINNFLEAAEALSKYTKIPATAIQEKLVKAKRPSKLMSQIDAASANKLKELHIPGIVVVTETARYNKQSLASHVLGYINSVDNQGVSGVEAMYDDVLKGGEPLYVAALVDAGQQLIPGLGYKVLKLDRGYNATSVMLTIDSMIQQKVEVVMDRHISKGAVVVLNPYSGEVLAMASRPNFSANDLPLYLNQESGPLLNRAVASYQPGSVFKLLVACSALEEKTVKPKDMFFDQGYIDVNNLRFKGWDYQQGVRGWISFKEALAYSSNPVFIEVGLKLGSETLVDYANRLGFGQRTSLEFPGEHHGNIPSADNLYDGDLANLSIGQGKVEATPIQIASLVATIVNDGVKINPYIVKALIDKGQTVIKSYSAPAHKRVFSSETARQLREMMKLVTTIGTGQLAYLSEGGSAGKTGSAETGRVGLDGKGINHAWFAGYAPLNRPQYVIVVFVEDGMSGGDVAAPIFKEILNEILYTK